MIQTVQAWTTRAFMSFHYSGKRTLHYAVQVMGGRNCQETGGWNMAGSHGNDHRPRDAA